mgnify:CR=1 FL=1
MAAVQWWQWEDELKRRDHSALDKVRETWLNRLLSGKVLQYFFFRQWKSLKQYVNDKGIDFIGDLPIYVSQEQRGCLGPSGTFPAG